MQLTLEAGTLKRIHVNQHNIRANQKAKEKLPVFTTKNRGKTITSQNVDIRGESRMVYSPDKPLPCGARVWMETRAEVVLW